MEKQYVFGTDAEEIKTDANEGLCTSGCGANLCANFPYPVPSGEQDVPLHRSFQGGASELHGAQDGEGNRGMLRPGHALQLQGTVSFAVAPM